MTLNTIFSVVPLVYSSSMPKWCGKMKQTNKKRMYISIKWSSSMPHGNECILVTAQVQRISLLEEGCFIYRCTSNHLSLLKHLSVAILTYQNWESFPYTLQATIHTLVEVCMQAMVPYCSGSHAQITQSATRDFLQLWIILYFSMSTSIPI